MARPWTLTYDLDLRRWWTRQCQDESAGRISFHSKVIIGTHTHTHTHTPNRMFYLAVLTVRLGLVVPVARSTKFTLRRAGPVIVLGWVTVCGRVNPYGFSLQLPNDEVSWNVVSLQRSHELLRPTKGVDIFRKSALKIYRIQNASVAASKFMFRRNLHSKQAHCTWREVTQHYAIRLLGRAFRLNTVQ